MTAKYICYKHDELVGEVAVIFPAFVAHKDMAASLCDFKHIVSAGFVAVMGDEFYPHGCSDSLGICARVETDKAIINRMFGGM